MSGTSKRLLFSTKGFSVCGNKCWKIMLHLTDQQFFYNFFIIFEKVFKMLTGRNLVTEYLSSVCIFKGETHAILALPGSITLLKLSLIAMANGFLKKIGDSIISFGEILPLDFLLSIFLKSCSTSQAETLVAVYSCELFFYVIFLFNGLVSIW